MQLDRELQKSPKNKEHVDALTEELKALEKRIEEIEGKEVPELMAALQQTLRDKGVSDQFFQKLTGTMQSSGGLATGGKEEPGVDADAESVSPWDDV